MTECDYSEEGRRRYIATQKRIAKWVHQTESSPQLSSAFSPPSRTGNHATSRPTHSLHSHSHGPTTQYTRTYHTSRSHAPVDSPYALYDLPSHVYPASSHSSRSSSSRSASTVLPSHSISQAPMSTHPSSPSHHTHTHSPSHHSTHGHQYHSHPQQHHRPSTYIISPPPSHAYAHRTPGILILPRPGHSPQVVFY